MKLGKKKNKPKEKYLSTWLDRVPQILYSPLHWLAYWDDHYSIKFLLSTICVTDKEKIKLMFKPNQDN